MVGKQGQQAYKSLWVVHLHFALKQINLSRVCVASFLIPIAARLLIYCRRICSGQRLFQELQTPRVASDASKSQSRNEGIQRLFLWPSWKCSLRLHYSVMKYSLYCLGSIVTSVKSLVYPIVRTRRSRTRASRRCIFLAQRLSISKSDDHFNTFWSLCRIRR